MLYQASLKLAEKESPIPDIPKSHQFGSVKKTVIKKNKVKKVEVEVNDVNMELLQLSSVNFNGYSYQEVEDNFNDKKYDIPLENRNSYEIEVSEFNDGLYNNKYATFMYRIKGDFLTMFDKLKGDYKREIFQTDEKMKPKDHVFNTESFSQMGQLAAFDTLEEFKNAFRYQDECAVGIIKELSSSKIITLACRIRFQGIIVGSSIVGVEYIYNANINIAMNNLEREQIVCKF